MTDIRSLEQTLLENLPWNKARIKFLARFLLALTPFRLSTSRSWPMPFLARRKIESSYKRLQRFLRKAETLGN